MLGKLLHTGLVAEDAAFRTFTGGVDSKNCQTPSLLLQHMDAKLVDTRGLTGARHTTDTHTYAVATIGQTLIDHLLCSGLMVGVHTFDEGDGL